MWCELIRALEPAATFTGGVSEPALRRAEAALGQPIPGALASLLRESDGVLGEYALGLVWSLERIVADNLSFRADSNFVDLYMPFRPLLFFADAGNGDQFAFLSPPVDRDDVFAWDHEDDSRQWFAADLRHYLEGWITGRLSV